MLFSLNASSGMRPPVVGEIRPWMSSAVYRVCCSQRTPAFRVRLGRIDHESWRYAP
jgi:hypothetical protein